MHLSERRDRVLRGERHLADVLLDEARRAFDQRAELVALLALPPSVERWSDITRLCAGRTPPLDLDEVDALLDRGWPDDLRVLPLRWLEPGFTPAHRTALRRLARRLVIDAPTEHDGALAGEGLDRITTLDVHGPPGPGPRFLPQRCSGLTALRTLRLYDVTDLDLRDALDAAHLRQLTHLEIRRASLSRGTIDALLEAPCLDTLHTLVLDQVGLTSQRACQVVATQRLGGLRTLDLSRNTLGGEAFVDALAGARHLGELRTLRLVDARVRADSARIPTLPHLRRLRVLHLAANRAGSCLLESLEDPETLPELAVLGVAHNQLGADGIAPLLAHTRGLTWLDLSDNDLGDAALAELCERARWPRLEHLALAGNGLTDAGVPALVRLRCMPSLTSLDLSHNVVRTPRGLDWLCTDDLDADDEPFALEHLDLTQNAVDAATAQRLLDSRRLARLGSLRVSSVAPGAVRRAGDAREIVHARRVPGEVADLTRRRPPPPARRPRRASPVSPPAAPPPSQRTRSHIPAAAPAAVVPAPPSPAAAPTVEPDRLETLLEVSPSSVNWASLVRAIERAASTADDLGALTQRLDSALSGWPDRLRTLPARWLSTQALSRLARTVAVRGADTVLRVVTTLGAGELPWIVSVALENQTTQALDAVISRLDAVTSVVSVTVKRCQLLPDHLVELAARFPSMTRLTLEQQRVDAEMVTALVDAGLAARLSSLHLIACTHTIADLEMLRARARGLDLAITID